jgi:BlaI family penicillinase repressor
VPTPKGNLTAAQYELMETVWDRGSRGASVAEIWQVVSAARPVGRTTILNLLRRLERRGWLVRRRGQRAYRYVAAISRDRTAALLAHSFVDDFFGGSASNLVMSLLGSRELNPDEIQRLRYLLESASSQADRKKGHTP